MVSMAAGKLAAVAPEVPGPAATRPATAAPSAVPNAASAARAAGFPSARALSAACAAGLEAVADPAPARAAADARAKRR